MIPYLFSMQSWMVASVWVKTVVVLMSSKVFLSEFSIFLTVSNFNWCSLFYDGRYIQEVTIVLGCTLWCVWHTNHIFVICMHTYLSEQLVCTMFSCPLLGQEPYNVQNTFVLCTAKFLRTHCSYVHIGHVRNY